MADPKAPNPILAEKQAMFAKQRARVETEKPLTSQQQAAFARSLVARLEKNARPEGPARITMASAGVLKEDPLPRTAHEPERIGGCFSDIHDETKRNEGAHEEKIEADTETAIPTEDYEAPFG